MKKCEGCGIFLDSPDKYKHINLTNGALTLCLQCLDDFNRKNPELIALKEEIKKLRNKEHED